MSKIPNLFLVEHFSHVDDLLKRKMRNQGQWIALGPGAMYALNREGISYKIPEDFCSNEEMGELCCAYHDKLKKFCNYADELLYDKYPELKEWGMQPFLFHMFPLVTLIDGMVSRIFQLRAILNKHPNYKIWIHIAPPVPLYPWGVYGIIFSNKETLWGHLLSLGGWKNEIEFLKEPKAVTPSSLDMRLLTKLREIKSYLLEFIRSSLKESSVLNHLVFNIKSSPPGGLVSRLGKERDSSLLIHSGIYNWAYTLPLLREKGYRVLFTNDQIFKSKVSSKEKNLSKDLDDLIKNNPQLMGVFDFDGISFYPLVRKRVIWILENSAQLCNKAVLKLKKIIAKYDVKAMLVAVSSTFISHVVQQAARYLGLPVICWQHGFITHNNGRITQLNEFNDMMTTDAVLTFGEEVTRAHSLYLNEFSSKVISVGSASIDKIRKANSNIKENFEKTILYVTSNYYQNLWYHGFDPPFNDRYLFKDQLAIMESLREIVDDCQAKVTVKLSPATFPFDPPFIGDFSERFRIVKSSLRFVDLLLENHIIVIEAPTTVALEATATKKPVFVLTRHIGYPDSALKMLEKRAVCSDNPQKLIDAIKDYIEHQVYPADVNNNEYLKTHGTYLDDGESDERAVDKVLEMIGARNQ